MQSNNEAINFIAENSITGALASLPSIDLPTNGDGTANLGAPPQAPAGWIIIAFTHTHPTNYGTTGDPTGVDSAAANAVANVTPGQPAYTNTLFSVADLEYANTYHLDAYVEVYSASSSANALGGLYTYNYGSWASGGVIGQTSSYSFGVIGGTSTWASC